MFPEGVPAGELRAAVALARLREGGEGVAWAPAVWERVFGRLTVLQQRVVYKWLLLGLPDAEIAGRLGIARGSVVSARRRALDRIRDAVPPPN